MADSILQRGKLAFPITFIHVLVGLISSSFGQQIRPEQVDTNRTIRVFDPAARKILAIRPQSLDSLARTMLNSPPSKKLTIPLRQVKAGPAKVSVVISPPEGYRLLDSNSYVLTWKGDGKKVSFTATLGSIALPDSGEVELPFLAVKGVGEMALESVVFFQQSDTAVCQFDHVVVTIPVQVEYTGPSMFGVNILARIRGNP